MSIVINGSGTITGITAGGLPDATITQAELASNVAGNGPAFSAYLNSVQSITAGVNTKITFDVEEFDTNNNFASSRFTPSVAGYYQLTASFYAASITTTLQLIFYKNGSVFKYGNGTASSSNSGNNSSALVYLNGTTDYVEVYAMIGATQNLQAGAATTYFQGFLVRAA